MAYDDGENGATLIIRFRPTESHQPKRQQVFWINPHDLWDGQLRIMIHAGIKDSVIGAAHRSHQANDGDRYRKQRGNWGHEYGSNFSSKFVRRFRAPRFGCST